MVKLFTPYKVEHNLGLFSNMITPRFIPNDLIHLLSKVKFKTNFKEQYGITKKPKESSTPIIKEPEYGLKWNDDESDENQG